MSVQDVFNELQQALLAIRQDIATNPGAVTADVFLSPSAYTINKNRTLLSYATALQTLFTIQLLLNNQDALQEIATLELESVDDVINDITNYLNNFGANFGIFRYAATSATGSVNIGRNEILTNDIIITPGQVFKTVDNREYTFNGSTAIKMSAPGSSYYDINYRRYLIPVPVTANDTGTAGNTVSGTITQIVGSITGITFVTNINSISNGADAETNTQFITRLSTILSGNTFGTVGGYRNLILNNFRNVTDAIVIIPGDSLMVRDNGSGGMVDIYILCEDPSIQITSTFNSFNTIVDGSNYKGVFLPLLPVDGNTPITAPATGLLHVDTGVLTGSYNEQSFVYFPTSPATPFDVTYNYFSIVNTVQSFLNLPVNAILGNTLIQNNAVENIALVKLAIKSLINISLRIAILPGFDIPTVISACQTAVNNAVGALGLGAPLPQSDIVAILEAVSGVNYVDLPFVLFNFTNSSVAEVDEIVPTKNEYLRINSLNISN